MLRFRQLGARREPTLLGYRERIGEYLVAGRVLAIKWPRSSKQK